MKTKLLYFFILIILMINCKKKDEISIKGYIIAGEKGDVFNIYSPIKLIQSTKISIVENNIAKDTIIGSFDMFDFNKDGLMDLEIYSTPRYPNKNSKAILLSSTNNNFSFCNEPLQDNDTINASLNWISLRFIDRAFLSLSDNSLNNWTTPKYFGFRLGFERNNMVYGWIKLEINDYNQLKIYSYSCSK